MVSEILAKKIKTFSESKITNDCIDAVAVAEVAFSEEKTHSFKN
jgi:hypothetical protein